LTVYFISGQAADETLFENLTLPSHVNIKHVHWIEPLKQESLIDYCKRLSQQIDTSDDFVLVGVSFGGISSVELNKILHPKQTIIISSIATKRELRPLLKFIRLFRMHKIVPAGFYKWYSPVLDWYFCTKTKREKELLKLYSKSATKNYMQWAVNQILNWQNQTRPADLFHIHGNNDRIFPCKRSHADILIKGGGHLMVHNRADEINAILTERINAIS
jgi:hypothetical protein